MVLLDSRVIFSQASSISYTAVGTPVLTTLEVPNERELILQGTVGKIKERCQVLLTEAETLKDAFTSERYSHWKTTVDATLKLFEERIKAIQRDYNHLAFEYAKVEYRWSAIGYEHSILDNPISMQDYLVVMWLRLNQEAPLELGMWDYLSVLKIVKPDVPKPLDTLVPLKPEVTKFDPLLADLYALNEDLRMYVAQSQRNNIDRKCAVQIAANAKKILKTFEDSFVSFQAYCKKAEEYTEQPALTELERESVLRNRQLIKEASDSVRESLKWLVSKFTITEKEQAECKEKLEISEREKLDAELMRKVLTVYGKFYSDLRYKKKDARRSYFMHYFQKFSHLQGEVEQHRQAKDKYLMTLRNQCNSKNEDVAALQVQKKAIESHRALLEVHSKVSDHQVKTID